MPSHWGSKIDRWAIESGSIEIQNRFRPLNSGKFTLSTTVYLVGKVRQFESHNFCEAKATRAYLAIREKDNSVGVGETRSAVMFTGCSAGAVMTLQCSNLDTCGLARSTLVRCNWRGFVERAERFGRYWAF
jgi:hypothetical protein